RGPKHGQCRLCGTVGPLSRTHVPPRASGNTGAVRTAVARPGMGGVPTLGLGTSKAGGMNGHWFCAACNGGTGRWDEAFLEWQATFLPVVRRDQPPIGELL